MIMVMMMKMMMMVMTTTFKTPCLEIAYMNAYFLLIILC